MTTEFESARSTFERNLEQARSTIRDLNEASNLSEKKSLLHDTKQLIEECKRNVQQMDYFWTTLDPSDKGCYKSELTEFKFQFESLKEDFSTYQKAIQMDEGDEESDEFSKLQTNTREILLQGVGKLSDQDNQLNNIVKNGHEATEILRGGNRELRAQRDLIENAGRNNIKAQNELRRGDSQVRKMRVREFCYRLVLYILIVALLAAMMCTLIIKLK